MEQLDGLQHITETNKCKVLLNNSMGNLLPAQTVIQTKDGELLVTINLNLNIKLDSSGQASVETEITPSANKLLKEKFKSQHHSVKFEKPDIEDNCEIIDFGKDV